MSNRVFNGFPQQPERLFASIDVAADVGTLKALL